MRTLSARVEKLEAEAIGSEWLLVIREDDETKEAAVARVMRERGLMVRPPNLYLIHTGVPHPKRGAST